MGHPHKSAAAESSREKFRAITGKRGGGHSHLGASHMKKAGEDGTHKFWSPGRNMHVLTDDKAHGGRAKKRADKYARGGATTEKKPKAISRSAMKAKMGKSKEFPSQIGTVSPDYFNRLSSHAQDVNPNEHSGMERSDLIGMSGAYKTYGDFDKPKQQSGYSRSDLEGMEDSRGGRAKRKKHKRASGGRTPQEEDWYQDTPGGPLGGANATSDIARESTSGRKYSPPQSEDWGNWKPSPQRGSHPASPRKKANGGAVAFADGGRAKGNKGPKSVTINITSPAGAAPPPPPPMPPPAPPPAPPPGGPPPGGGMPPPGGAPGGGANPLAALGKGMGGMARGGRATGHRDTAQHKLTGDSNYDLKHWRDYANRDKRVKTESRASGGRMTAGAFSGVGRLEQAKRAKS